MSTDNRYSRRDLLKTGLASLTGLSLLDLAACNTAAQPASTQGPISLQMIFWGSATRNKLTRQAIDIFHQSHANVTIDSQYFGQDLYYTKLNARIAAGAPPDLIQMDMRYISQYVRKQVLLDLTQYIYDQTIDLSDFDPVLLNGSKVNNTIYGIPLGSNYQCFYYDTTQIEKAGVGPIPQNMTWDIFAAYCSELSRALGNGTYGTADASGNYDVFEIWIRQRGKELYTKEGALDFDETDVGDWFNYWATVRKNNGCPPMSLQAKLDLSGTPADSSVIKGKAVFSHLFSNQLQAFQAATPHPLALLAYPRGSVPGLFLKVSQMLSVANATRYPDQAASFTGFAVTDPGAVKALGLERGFPGSAAALAVLKPQFSPTQLAMVDFMNQMANSGDTRPKEVLEPPGAGQIASDLQNISLDIGNGKVSISAGAHEFYLNAQKATA